MRRTSGSIPIRRSSRRAVTLIEAVLASVILAISVVALSSAVAAGQRASVDGQRMLLGALVADDLLAELRTVPYASLAAYDGVEQDIGALTTVDGVPYPIASYWDVGRRIVVETVDIEPPGLGVKIRGRRIVVVAFDESRDLIALEAFVPEPA